MYMKLKKKLHVSCEFNRSVDTHLCTIGALGGLHFSSSFVIIEAYHGNLGGR